MPSFCALRAMLVRLFRHCDNAGDSFFDGVCGELPPPDNVVLLLLEDSWVPTRWTPGSLRPGLRLGGGMGTAGAGGAAVALAAAAMAAAAAADDSKLSWLSALLIGTGEQFGDDCDRRTSCAFGAGFLFGGGGIGEPNTSRGFVSEILSLSVFLSLALKSSLNAPALADAGCEVCAEWPDDNAAGDASLGDQSAGHASVWLTLLLAVLLGVLLDPPSELLLAASATSLL
mmetsp:Transcript_23978/g.41963  ORF Transcript_23978/g.41963 Transcript_23978/m.41963 type:complete len:229 (-) Transcript_23978:29-715(-)